MQSSGICLEWLARTCCYCCLTYTDQEIFTHHRLLRKDDGYIGRRMLKMELPGKRKRGRPKRRFMDVVKEDMAEVEVKEEDADDRSNWRLKIRCGDP